MNGRRIRPDPAKRRGPAKTTMPLPRYDASSLISAPPFAHVSAYFFFNMHLLSTGCRPLFLRGRADGFLFFFLFSPPVAAVTGLLTTHLQQDQQRLSLRSAQDSGTADSGWSGHQNRPDPAPLSDVPAPVETNSVLFQLVGTADRFRHCASLDYNHHQ